MNEPANGRIGIPGAGTAGNPTPGASHGGETDRLLQAVEDDLDSLDQLETVDQVAVFDRAHSTLAEALARTADTGAPLTPGPPPGEPRA